MEIIRNILNDDFKDIVVIGSLALGSVVVENVKTGMQLKEFDTPNFKVPELNVLLKGSPLSFWRGTIRMGVNIATTSSIEPNLAKWVNLPWIIHGTSGVLFGTFISHPLDTVRARQGATTFAGEFEDIEKNVSLMDSLTRYNILDLFDGWVPSLVLFSLEHILTNVFNECIFKSIFSSSLLSWFAALSTAKVVLTPVEIAKKKIQDKDGSENFVKAIANIYDRDGFQGLWIGWYFGVFESVCTVFITNSLQRIYTRRPDLF